MAWNVIRKATTEDVERLQSAGERFIERYGLSVFGGYDKADQTAASFIMCAVDRREDAARWGNWIKCVRRALRDNRATGIAYDCVGYSVD